MILTSNGPTTTVRRRTVVRDQYGHATTTVLTSAVQALGVAPRASSEQQTVGRGAVLEGLTLYLPPGTVLDPDDQLTIDGYLNSDGQPRLYEVEGEPGVWTSPFTGETWGVEVAVKRATG